MIIIGLGSNKSFCGQQPAEIVPAAMQAVAKTAAAEGNVLTSSLYESEAWPDPTDPPYVNAVMALEDTELLPHALLAALQAIEDGFGRERAYLMGEGPRYAPRTLDLDLLCFHNEVSENDALSLPHPAIAERAFVLLPLVEILPAWAHPVSGTSAKDILSALDCTGVRKI
jgi:2-amino-4-hydroxy-6-hydroxymethyldihydropteridine diphosphokinase